jgi:hypothetical protein
MKKEEELKRRVAVKLEVAGFLQVRGVGWMGERLSARRALRHCRRLPPRQLAEHPCLPLMTRNGPSCSPPAPQDTVAEMAREIKNKRTGEVSASADELFQFINKVGVAGCVRGERGFVTFVRRTSGIAPWGAPRVCSTQAAPAKPPLLAPRSLAPQKGPRRRARGHERARQVRAALQRRADAGPPGQVGGRECQAVWRSLAQSGAVWRSPAQSGAVGCSRVQSSGPGLRSSRSLQTLPHLASKPAYPRVQLVSMCQLLSIPPFGTDGFLRNRLRSQLEKIKQARTQGSDVGVVLGARGLGGRRRCWWVAWLPPASCRPPFC